MPSVDDRIVRIEFDNSAFERKVADTLASLQRLNDSLRLPNAAHGFSDISAASDRVNFGGMSSAVDGLSTKFLALSTIAITALANITSRAVDAGINITRSLSIEQVLSGFREYESGIQSIQTILSNTRIDGTSLEQVTAALDELNHYADQTIYNFGQMTRNIGTFTAAGVDLETSVDSIKGISNLAAISGSTAEQASSAMYQLSQAVSTGTLRLIDWNSVVNAGMGGEVFQRALFETGVAMGTIVDAPVGTTFEQWTADGNSFRSSLEDNWLTAEVLTTTLQGFTGEMTEAQLLAIGYTQTQAAAILEMGQIGVEAATKVRTLSQLIDTTKEALGSGWAQSFRIAFGDFEEATDLFTGISTAVSGFVSASADARNEILQSWSDMGGRALLINGLQNAFENLTLVMTPIKEAFREIFPPLTAERLFEITRSFSRLMDRLRPGEQTVDNIRRIFRGLFAALEIGWTVVKEGTKFFIDLFQSVTGAGSGDFLSFVARIGDFFTDLNARLVEGEGIKKFFEDLTLSIQPAIELLRGAKNVLLDVFSGRGVNLEQFGPAGEAISRLGDRFDTLRGIVENLPDIWAPFQGALGRVTGILDGVWNELSTWFSELGAKLAASFDEDDFDATLDVINVGLLGGIGVLIANFLRRGFNFDIGSGLLSNISRSFEELTGVLTAMQTNLRAQALMRIAAAIGILTASVLVLSTIDSEALSRSLTAMAVGFGQLLASFAIIARLQTGVGSAASFIAISTGLIALSGAILVLTVAVRNMAGLEWDELARGMSAIMGLITGLTIAVRVMSGNTAGMIGAGIGMTAIAVALNILAGAVAIFATMEWEEMAQGLAGVAGGLAIIVAAMQLMPRGMLAQSAALLGIAVALNALALAVLQFSAMDWDEMGRGFAGIGGGLLIIAGAMQLMPPNMLLTAAGLIIVSLALVKIGEAMQAMGGMSWEEIGRGLTAMAGSLLILGTAMHFMQGSVIGAAALVIIAGGLTILADVLEQMAALSWGELLRGLAGIAGVLGVLGGAAYLLTPVIPALLGLGAALILVGAGFALFGAGAQMVAKALETFAGIDPEALLTALNVVAQALPALIFGFVEGVANGLVELLTVLIDFAPTLIQGLGVILGHILDSIVELIPKVLVVIGTLISGILGLIREKFPELVETGFGILTALLTGIRDNIGQVVTLVSEIIQNFLVAFQEQFPPLAHEIVNTIIVVFETVSYEVGRAMPSIAIVVVRSFFEGFWDGIEEQLPGVTSFFEEFAPKVLGWIGNVASLLWGKGTDLIAGLFTGITTKIVDVTTFFIALPGNILGWIGDLIRTLAGKGRDLLTGLKTGIDEKVTAVTSFFTGLGSSVANWVGNVVRTLYLKGKDILEGFKDGIDFVWENNVKFWFERLPRIITNLFTGARDILLDTGKAIMNGLWDGLKAIWEEITGWFTEITNLIPDWKGPPARDRVLLYGSGVLIMQGFQNGMERMWSTTGTWLRGLNPADEIRRNTVTNMANTMASLTDRFREKLGNMDEFRPVITPVLDLTQVSKDARLARGYIEGSLLGANYSYAQARAIASTTTPFAEENNLSSPAPAQITFEQNIYSPKSLSTTDIYRNTRNQIVIAKEELSIP